jgi:hypothetical protein
VFLATTRLTDKPARSRICRNSPSDAACESCVQPCGRFTLAAVHHELELLQETVLRQWSEIAALEVELASMRTGLSNATDSSEA